MSKSVATDCKNPLWGDDWEDVRDLWALDPSISHLNHGAYGAVPKVVREHQRELVEKIDRNPSGFYRRELDTLLENARLGAASFCLAAPDGFAWVRNASEGMSVALNNIPMKSADELIITNHIYPAVRLAVENKCATSGARAVEVVIPADFDDQKIVETIAGAITPRTRLIIVDEIASPSARLFPIRELSELTREKGIVLLVDGAHAPGMYPLSVDNLGADLWVGNFHKWVCAPQGAGAIWAASSWRDKMRPSSVSYRDRLPYPQLFGRLGTDDLTAILTVPFAIEFIKKLDLYKLYRYNSELAAYGADVIARAIGAPPLPGRYAARRPISLPEGVGTSPETAQALQTKIAVEMRTEVSVGGPLGEERHGTITICAYAYNHPEEYDQLAEKLKKLLR